MTTAADVLAQVLEAGGRIIADPDRPRLQAPPHLRPLIEEHREALRELVRTRAKAAILAASPEEPQAPGKPSRWPEGHYLVVAPEWWTGPPFYVTRTPEEAEALAEEGIPAGMIWHLEEARRLAGLKPEEKMDAASVKAMFSGEVVASAPRRRRRRT